jgi:PKD repeat protein
MTHVDELLASGAENSSSGFYNRPLASPMFDGPEIFGPLPAVQLEAHTGWYDGDHVTYYDLGQSQATAANVYMFYYENISDDHATKVPGQKVIIDDIPGNIFVGNEGDYGYTGLWSTVKVLVDEDYEPNTVKSVTDIISNSYPTVEVAEPAVCPVLPFGSVFLDHPDGETTPEQGWYRDNPVYIECMSSLSESTYNTTTHGVKLGNIYTFPQVDGHLPIFDTIPVDADNYTAVWQVMNVSVPDDHELDQLRDADTIEALIGTTGGGYEATIEGTILAPIVGDIVTEGIAPQARAGTDVTAKQGMSVTFDGSDSTDNVDIVSYNWTFEDNGTMVQLEGAIASYIFEVIDVINVTLTVADGEALEDSDVMVVTVIDGYAPIPDAGEDRTVLTGEMVVFNASNSTDNVGITEYLWDFGDNMTRTGMLVNHTYVNPGTYNVTLNVTDAEGNWAVDTLVVTVVAPNNPPQVVGILDQEVTVGYTFRYQVMASDPDGDNLTYNLIKGPDGMVVDPSTGEITYLAQEGHSGLTYFVEVRVSDGQANVSVLFNLLVKAVVVQDINVTLGPIRDENDDNVKGVLVEITYDFEYRNSTTDNYGKTTIKVPASWVNRTVTVTISKDGYEKKTFMGTIGEDGSFTPSNGKYPEFKTKSADVKPDYNFLILALVVLIVLIVVLVFMKKPEEEEDWKDEEGVIPDEEE